MQRSKFFFRGLAGLLLLSLLVAGMLGGAGLPVRAAPETQTVTSVVISEFRFDGPSGGNDEFIELHNQTSSQVNIKGWKIWGSNNSGGIGNTPRYSFPTTVDVILQPGQYYLITNNSTPGYSGTVPGDATYGSGITEDGGIALTLPNNTIVDAIGLSSGSAYLEGTPLAKLSGSNNQGYARQGGGCFDTNNNAVDFILQAPSDPQNSTSIPIKCLKVINVTSTVSDSPPAPWYVSGDSIPITVEFSSNVNVTGAPTLLLETGSTDKTATYASGSGSSILTFNYVVQPDDVSADLDYVATNSLSLNGGAITGAVGDADLTLPAPGTTGSLGANKAIVIDNKVAPSLLSFKRQNPSTSPTNVTTLIFRATFSEPVVNVDVTDFTGDVSAAGVTATVTTVTNVNPVFSSVYDITVSVVAPPSSPNFDIGLNLNAIPTQNITDAVGMQLPNGEPGIDEVYIVHTAPPTGTITIPLGQANPAKEAPVVFAVTFSEEINASKFTASDITQKGTALVNAWSIVDSGNHISFTLSATTVSSNGTIIPSVGAGKVEDLAGNPSTAEIVGASINFQDDIRPSVTINQAADQANSTNILPIKFTVVFSEPIIASIFKPNDITQSGTATGITWSITNSGDDKTFTLSATAVTGYGTLVPSIAANRVTDLVGNNNTASTSTDNLVQYIATQPLIVVINEVAWAGTQASPDDEWIELYNPGNQDIDLTGWSLVSSDNSPNIKTEFNGVIIGKGDYLLMEQGNDDTTDVNADLIYTGNLTNTGGEILRLYDSNGTLIDTANINSGPWPAGIASTFSSMQRSIISADSDYVWVTYDVTKDTSTGVTKAKDALGNLIKGTPGRANTPINVTPTATPRPANTAIPGSTAVGGVVISPVIGISEYLPRPGYDWNNDGLVDVFDEFIEVINAGRIDINLSAYQLDDEQGRGSVPYILPNITLKPGERAVFYASETGILLSDAGDTVRLLRGSTVVDAHTYTVVRYPDESWCRIPDRMGYWNNPCFPTPNNPNALTGTIPSPPEYETGYHPPACLLPDTTPEEFVYAECETGGDEIWNRQYWDAGDDADPLQMEEQKWDTVFE